MTEAAEKQLAYAFAKDKGLVVMTGRDQLTLGVRNGADPFCLVEARRVLRAPFALESLEPAAFDRQLSETYARGDLDGGEAEAALAGQEDLASLVDGIPQTADLLDGDDDAPVIRLINGLIYEAVKRRASDIHVEPYEDKLSIRYRIDGVLQEVLTPSRRLAPPLVSRIKVMARLDIAEKRVPQDGRISLSIGGRSIDVRVSTLPSRYGERVVLRLLDAQQAKLDLEELGMDADTLARFKEALAEPNGVILVTGPTGSGKTTTLYSALTLLNDGARNILTVEDPIEYGLPGVGQTQVNEKVGMTFAAGLRAILRQDPNVIMVGEIRDPETAQIAVQSSLTGHIVLSTVHTNSAAAAITRLRDIGVEPFLLSSTIRAILAQRLVRRLCSQCKERYEPDPATLELMQIPPGSDVAFYRPRGCMACSNTGYNGRLGVYELMTVEPSIRQMINESAAEQDIEAAAFKDHDTLFANGRRRVISGDTSPEEVLRVCRREGEGHGGV
ncbi:MAG: type II secretion system ATPase GspE [Pseudomonadota bacterium]